jgi:hypothetical protein
MDKQQKQRGRRAFLRESVQTLLVAPLAAASVTAPRSEDLSEFEEPDPFPGPSDYRDPGPYGSLAD